MVTSRNNTLTVINNFESTIAAKIITLIWQQSIGILHIQWNKDCRNWTALLVAVRRLRDASVAGTPLGSRARSLLSRIAGDEDLARERERDGCMDWCYGRRGDDLNPTDRITRSSSPATATRPIATGSRTLAPPPGHLLTPHSWPDPANYHRGLGLTSRIPHGLSTDTSEHIRLLLSSFSVFHFLVVGSVW